MQSLKWFIFCNIFLYCKIIISFLELFSVNCFLRILQTQYFGISSTPKKLKKRQHMAFMMTSSNDDKSFLSRLISYCQCSICTKFHVKWTNIF